MLKLIKFLKPYKKEVILGPIFKLVEAIFELIVPLIMASVIDIGVKKRDISYVVKMGFLMIGLGVVGLCSTIVCQSFAAKASQGFGTKLRNELFRHINTFSHKELDMFETGELTTRMTNDINQLQLAVAMLIRLVIRAPFLIVGAIIMAISIDLKMSVIFFITAVLISIALYLIITKSVPFLKKIQSTLDQLTLITKEDLDGTRVIRAFSKQDWSENRFNSINDKNSDTICKLGKISSLLNPVTYVVINLAIIFIIWFGAKETYRGNLSQGQIIALVNYMTQILLALIVVANLVVIFTKAFTSAYRVNQIFEVNNSIETNSVPAKLPHSQNAETKIQFENVSFSYQKSSAPALNNISISIKPGEKIGIIGGTGSGKSTFINLIARFYDANSGKILIDGVDIKDYPVDILRKKIAIVHQNPMIFSGTIKENLLWGKHDASENDMKEALRIAQALDFVESKPGKLEEKVEQGGKNFSGGQRQRLTIARALIKKPEILILDDSSSALDYETEAKFRQNLSQSTHNTTILTVSQRPVSIKHCDKILVFDEGNIVAFGTHDELIKTCDNYREICMSQSEEAAS